MKESFITYTLTVKDLSAFATYHFLTHQAALLALSLAGIGLISWMGAISHAFSGDDFLVGFIDIFFAILPAILCVASVLYPRRIAMISSISFVLISAMFFFSGNSTLIYNLIPFLAMGWLGMGFQKYTEYFYGSKTDVIGERTLTIGDDGIYEKTPSSETQVSWDLVTDIRQTEDYLYFFLGRGSGYIVPKIVFGTPKEAGAFFNEAVALRRDAGLK